MNHFKKQISKSLFIFILDLYLCIIFMTSFLLFANILYVRSCLIEKIEYYFVLWINFVEKASVPQRRSRHMLQDTGPCTWYSRGQHWYMYTSRQISAGGEIDLSKPEIILYRSTGGIRCICWSCCFISLLLCLQHDCCCWTQKMCNLTSMLN